jgi:hypothetical protein
MIRNLPLKKHVNNLSLEVATSLAEGKRPELASRTGVGLVETCTAKLHIFQAKFKSFRCQLELAATLNDREHNTGKARSSLIGRRHLTAHKRKSQNSLQSLQ